MRATKTMHVDAEPDRVLSFFVDPSFTPPGMTMEVVHESPAIVGNTYAWTFKTLGMRRKGVTVYTEYVPDERVAFRHFGALEGTATWTVEPEDGGSKVTGQTEFRLPIPVIGRFFEPLLIRQWDKNLAWGKRVMEKKPQVEEATA